MPLGGGTQRAGQSQPHSGIWGWDCHSDPDISDVDPVREGKRLTQGHIVGKRQIQDWTPVKFLDCPASPRSLGGAALGCGQEESASCKVSDGRNGGSALGASLPLG